jgi:hypothetical protein
MHPVLHDPDVGAAVVDADSIRARDVEPNDVDIVAVVLPHPVPAVGADDLHVRRLGDVGDPSGRGTGGLGLNIAGVGAVADEDGHARRGAHRRGVDRPQRGLHGPGRFVVAVRGDDELGVQRSRRR